MIYFAIYLLIGVVYAIYSHSKYDESDLQEEKETNEFNGPLLTLFADILGVLVWPIFIVVNIGRN